MKAYDEEKCLLGVFTLDDLGLTQDQGQTCQSFTIQAIMITWNSS